MVVPSAPRALFVDAGAEALAPARQSLRDAGIGADWLEWSEPAPEPLPQLPGVGVVVIGPGVANPAFAARRLAREHPDARVLIVAAPECLEAARRALLYAAIEGDPWQLLRAGDRGLAEAVLEALAAAHRRAQFRSTLDRVSLRLSAPAQVDVQQYRRLVVSDQYLASVLRHAPDAILSLDLQGRILSWNAGAARLFGRTARDVSGERLEDLARWPGPLEPLLDEAVREGFVRRELRVGMETGAADIDATFSTIQESGTEATAVAVILRDVTERRLIEAALAENEARFRALADNIPQLAWMADAAGALLWVNRRWVEYTGATLEDRRRGDWTRLYDPEEAGPVLEKFRAHVEEGTEWEDTFRLRSAHGELRWFLSRAFPIRDGAGKILNWFGTNTDIHAERAAQEALREADRRKDEFIGLLSHELRNPLAPIRNSIYLLDRAGGNEALARRAREVIRRQTDHLTRLVDDLLDVTRIARGKVTLRRERA
ncbi:MAG TPA: PAS domain S-box protein, partial [Myxococcota bacterium]|nr:PAS domain S-box protein [Myxococcota bacterium]